MTAQPGEYTDAADPWTEVLQIALEHPNCRSVDIIRASRANRLR